MAPPRWIVWFSLLHQRMLIVSDLFTGTPPFSTCKNDLPDPGDRHSIREATSAAFAPISFPDHIRYLQTWARIHGSNKPGVSFGGYWDYSKIRSGDPRPSDPYLGVSPLASTARNPQDPVQENRQRRAMASSKQGTAFPIKIDKTIFEQGNPSSTRGV